ncbi:MAG: chromosomal replication initiator DnaA [Xanthobacteraceae bacterium]|nr:chromosomal replication initiator DnaA [Xanthobacteraceae bacterium]
MDRSASTAAITMSLPPPDRVLRAVTLCVARDFGLDPADLLARTRGAPRVAFARQVAVYLAHVSFGLSFAAIGRLFHRDRTTVAHACRVIEDRRDDRELDRRLTALERACRRVRVRTGGGGPEASRPAAEAGQ